MASRYLTLSAVLMMVLMQTILSEAELTEQSFHESLNCFTLDLYGQMREDSKSLFFSPMSISLALAMTSLGARGDTLTQVMTALKLNENKKCENQRLFKSFRENLFGDESEKPYTLSLANRIFGEKSYTFTPKFIQETTTYFNAKLEPLNFKGDSEAARIQINDWVLKMTNNKINEMIPDGVLSSLTKLVLVNAIYFKGEWSSKFPLRNTRESDFHVSENEVIRVPLMYGEITVNYTSDGDLKSEVVELPYKGDRLSMVIILPNLKLTTLEQVENSLTASVISNLKFVEQVVDVWVPKFKLESSFDLIEKLKPLGIKDIFENGKADLSGIDGSGSLAVSDALHKSFVEVNEEGAEAAAATSMVALTRSLSNERVRADHPFIFYIWDKKSILFLGRFIKP